jgi:hypothetical protein
MISLVNLNEEIVAEIAWESPSEEEIFVDNLGFHIIACKRMTCLVYTR